MPTQTLWSILPGLRRHRDVYTHVDDRRARSDGLRVAARRLFSLGHFGRTIAGGPVHRSDSGRLSYGPFSKRFEQLWAQLHDSKFSVFCNSGTSALQISLQALKELHDWSDGDEVLVPSVTFVAKAGVVLHNRLTPVFVDVDPLTYNIDPALVEAKITPRTKAIIPVHLAGLPANMSEIAYLSGRHALKIVEDSCETTFAKHAGRSVGAWGDLGYFSTYMAHYVVTGVGGLVTTSNPDLAAIVRSLMNHGRNGIYVSIDDDGGLTGEKLKEMISKRFSLDGVGHIFRCTEMETALGLAQLENWEEIVRGRKRVAHHYTTNLTAKPGIEQHLQLPRGDEHVYMIYPLVVKGAKQKGPLTQHLAENGIETRDLLPLLGQPVYKKMFGDLLEKYPVAKMLDACGLSSYKHGEFSLTLKSLSEGIDTKKDVPSHISQDVADFSSLACLELGTTVKDAGNALCFPVVPSCTILARPTPMPRSQSWLTGLTSP